MALEQHPSFMQGSPVLLLFKDVKVLITMLPYLKDVLRPFSMSIEGGELYKSPRNIRAKLMLGFVSTLEAFFLLPTFLFLVFTLGFVLSIFYGLNFLVVKGLLGFSQGPRLVHSGYHGPKDMERVNLAWKKERWVFFNGIMSGETDLQAAVDTIEKTFGRPVIGVHNETLGFVGDIMECLIQRCLSYSTIDVRLAYETLKSELVNPEVEKVILIAHSQGGIIASLVVDRLLAELAHDMVTKLEIYTFGSAASHFSNPLTSAPPTSNAAIKASPLSRRVIKHIEHYVNERDMVPRWGVLNNIYDIKSNKYCGRVFIRRGATGHLFCQHYLCQMFPHPPTGSVDPSTNFLTQPVNKEISPPTEREYLEPGDLIDLRSQDSSLHLKLDGTSVIDVAFGDGEHFDLIAVDKAMSDGGLDDVNAGIFTYVKDSIVGGEANGRTVKELSRLWRYIGGGAPQ